MSWVTFLLSMVGPIVIKVLAALGLGLITFTGITEIVQSLISGAQSSYSGMPAAVLGLCSLAGVPQALGLIFGAFSARASLWVAANTAKLVFK